MVDYCTKYEDNQPILVWDITTNIRFKKNIAIIIQIWHRAKWYFTCISNTRTWLLYQIWIKSTNSSLRYTSNAQNVWKSDHLLKFGTEPKHEQHMICGDDRQKSSKYIEFPSFYIFFLLKSFLKRVYHVHVW